MSSREEAGSILFVVEPLEVTSTLTSETSFKRLEDWLSSEKQRKNIEVGTEGSCQPLGVLPLCKI